MRAKSGRPRRLRPTSPSRRGACIQHLPPAEAPASSVPLPPRRLRPASPSRRGACVQHLPPAERPFCLANSNSARPMRPNPPCWSGPRRAAPRWNARARHPRCARERAAAEASAPCAAKRPGWLDGGRALRPIPAPKLSSARGTAPTTLRTGVGSEAGEAFRHAGRVFALQGDAARRPKLR